MRVTIRNIQDMKNRGEKIPMTTAYDYTSAQIVEQAGVPIILVGDSLGQVILGYGSTIPVTLDDMLHHTRAVVRGTNRALVTTDLPFLSYHLDENQALHSAGRCLQEGGAQAVKLEGGARMAATVRRLTENGIPVVGHLGLTPQSVHQLGGYKVQGNSAKAAADLMADAIALEQAGAFSLVLELVPEPLSRIVTKRLRIPTIGIGAGNSCDGQVQVLHDMLGLYSDIVPKHTKRYVDLGQIIRRAVEQYIEEVQSGQFPTEKESSTMDGNLLVEAGLVEGH